MRKHLLLGAAVLLATAGLARAADAPNVVEVRQVGMALLGGDFAGIRAVVAAKGDVKTLEGPAKAMQRWAALVPAVFPAGSNTGSNTKANPEVWTDMVGFHKAAAAMGEAAGKMVELAKAGDTAGVEAQVKVLGGTCAGCHNTYKAK